MRRLAPSVMARGQLQELLGGGVDRESNIVSALVETVTRLVMQELLEGEKHDDVLPRLMFFGPEQPAHRIPGWRRLTLQLILDRCEGPRAWSRLALPPKTPAWIPSNAAEAASDR